jgi:hypothetical protein
LKAEKLEAGKRFDELARLKAEVAHIDLFLMDIGIQTAEFNDGDRDLPVVNIDQVIPGGYRLDLIFTVHARPQKPAPPVKIRHLRSLQASA